MQDSVGTYMKRINEALERIVTANVRQFGLTGVQSRMLRFLHRRREKKTTLKDVERHLGTSHVAVSKLAARLEQNGYVTITRDEDDKRQKIVALTEKEAHVYNAAMRRHAESEALIANALTAEELKILRIALSKISIALSGNAPTETQTNP